MRTISFSILALLCVGTTAQAQEATCEDFDHARLARSVVQLVFMYDEPKPDGSIGHRGTAWFIDPTHLVTIGHLTDDVLGADWQTVTIGYSEEQRTAPTTELEIPMRLVRTIKTAAPDHISIIELEYGMLGFEPLQVRYDPPKKDEPVAGVGYADGELRFAVGWHRVPEQSSEEATTEPPEDAGYLYFEIFDQGAAKRQRYVFEHGASGSPIVDCDGQVVAVAGNFLTKIEDYGVMKMLGTTSWGLHNITGLPASQIVPP